LQSNIYIRLFFEMRKSLLIYIYLLISLNGTSATFTLTQSYQKAYAEILRLRFKSASEIITAEKKVDPGNVAYCYLEAYKDFLTAIISEKNTDYKNFSDLKSERIKILSTIEKKSPWLLYSQAQLTLQKGVLAVKNNDYVQAAIEVKRAYSLFAENDRSFPDFLPNKAGLGLLITLTGSIPDSYKWVPGLFGMEGSISKGMEMLKRTLLYNPSQNNWPYLFNESLFITTFITFNLAGTDENLAALSHFLDDPRLKSELPINPLLIYAVSSFYSYKGLNDKAIELLSKRPSDASYYSFDYLDYLTGIAYLNKLDPKARIYFLRYVTNFRGKNFIKSAYQHLAWSFLIDNDLNGYNTYISRVILFGVDNMENDKEALNEAIKKQSPEPSLLKARLLFDGGYYSRSKELLFRTNTERFSKDQKLEYNYRFARISHKEGNIDKAKEYYYITYNEGRNSTTWYAANSILNLGLIYEQNGNNRQAEWCYRKCLQLDFTQYKSGIQQKAKAGLNRVL